MPCDENKESYTVEEMAEHVASEAVNGTELLQTLASHGFELSKPEGEQADENKDIPAPAPEVLPVMPRMFPAQPKSGLDIVALRIDASKKALGKHRGGQDG